MAAGGRGIEFEDKDGNLIVDGDGDEDKDGDDDNDTTPLFVPPNDDYMKDMKRRNEKQAIWDKHRRLLSENLDEVEKEEKNIYSGGC